MAKALAIISSEESRRLVHDWIDAAKIGTRVEIKGPKRTLPQNDRMWAMLTDIVRQKKTINGSAFTTDEWKMIFMQALGKEQIALPTLEGDGFFAIGHSSSAMEKQEMSDLIELIFAWGAENHVVWSDPALRSYEEMMR